MLLMSCGIAGADEPYSQQFKRAARMKVWIVELDVSVTPSVRITALELGYLLKLLLGHFYLVTHVLAWSPAKSAPTLSLRPVSDKIAETRFS